MLVIDLADYSDYDVCVREIGPAATPKAGGDAAADLVLVKPPGSQLLESTFHCCSRQTIELIISAPQAEARRAGGALPARSLLRLYPAVGGRRAAPLRPLGATAQHSAPEW